MYNNDQFSVLVACERQGRVREAFRSLGFDAWSNDIKPADDRSPYHIQGDCAEVIRSKYWDLIILHPPCDYLAISGNAWYGRTKKKWYLREQAIDWTLYVWRLAKECSVHVAMENPIGVIPIPATQNIHPYQFGHGERKTTCLWLCNLPKLEPTQLVQGRREYVYRLGQQSNRKLLRSVTYQGIADAMADQWGRFIVDYRIKQAGA